jgi:CheY-like chemotaxis protein
MSHYLNSLYVLLVEPSRSQRRIVLQQFEDLGINQYDTVDTGEEALVRIDTEQPDLVISALFLDDMTGRDLVLEMRDNPVSRDTPFMLISSETSFRELDPVKQAGASAVLPKPFRVEDLKRAINMIMDWDNPEAVELDRDLRILLVDDSKLARRLITRRPAAGSASPYASTPEASRSCRAGLSLWPNRTRVAGSDARLRTDLGLSRGPGARLEPSATGAAALARALAATTLNSAQPIDSIRLLTAAASKGLSMIAATPWLSTAESLL